MVEAPPALTLTTGSEDYGDYYYSHHLGCDEDYAWESPHWQQFFLDVAERLVRLLEPKRVLDVGCGKGLLVQALVQHEVDAYGFDISEFAIKSASLSIKNRLHVATAAEPISDPADLIICIEVLEHIAYSAAESALNNITAATQRVLFSSSPSDFAEPTHVNVRTPAEWSSSFAERGFFKRTDLDLSFITPWAALYEKVDLTARDVATRYETVLYPLHMQVTQQRSALLEAHRAITALTQSAGGDVAPNAYDAASKRVTQLEKSKARLKRDNRRLQRELKAMADDRDALTAQLLDARHQLLTVRDHVIGAEATAATAKIEREKALSDMALAKGRYEYLSAELNRTTHELHERLQAIITSERWRVGGLAMSPAVGIKRLVHRGNR